jgi:hypothetical protein
VQPGQPEQQAKRDRNVFYQLMIKSGRLLQSAAFSCVRGG